MTKCVVCLRPTRIAVHGLGACIAHAATVAAMVPPLPLPKLSKGRP